MDYEYYLVKTKNTKEQTDKEYYFWLYKNLDDCDPSNLNSVGEYMSIHLYEGEELPEREKKFKAKYKAAKIFEVSFENDNWNACDIVRKVKNFFVINNDVKRISTKPKKAPEKPQEASQASPEHSNWKKLMDDLDERLLALCEGREIPEDFQTSGWLHFRHSENKKGLYITNHDDYSNPFRVSELTAAKEQKEVLDLADTIFQAIIDEIKCLKSTEEVHTERLGKIIRNLKF